MPEKMTANYLNYGINLNEMIAWLEKRRKDIFSLSAGL